MNVSAVITGLGDALPKRCVTNEQLPAELDTSDEWIRERTGIKQRYIAGEGESTASLATDAARNALSNAKLAASDIDLIIVSTSTPDLTMPSTACLVQAELGNKRAAAFDINAACSGFVYGLSVANAMLKSRQASKALVIGAETMSRIVDWNDRRSCVLFGDGAGAAILEAQTQGGQGILTCHIESDGSHSGILRTNGGVSSTQTAGHLHMQGKEVFRHAVDKMGGGLQALLTQAGLSLAQLNWVIPHQANKRIIDAIAKKTAIPESKFIVTLDQHANTSAASIPLALTHASKANRFKSGHILALPALGAGLTWGGCIIKWQN